jgi:predicted transcriptional regulator
MITGPVVCKPGTPTFEVQKTMHDNELTGVPIVQNKKIIGIFAIKDYLKTVDFLFKTFQNHLESWETSNRIGQPLKNGLKSIKT